MGKSGGLEQKLYKTIIQCYKELKQNNQDADLGDLFDEIKRFPEYKYVKEKTLKKKINDVMEELELPAEEEPVNDSKADNKPNAGDQSNTGDEEIDQAKKKTRYSDGEDKFKIITESYNFSILGGLSKLTSELSETISVCADNTDTLQELGIKRINKNFLITGPAGSGKTTLGLAICGELCFPTIQINSVELFAGITGQSEAKLRKIFEDLKERQPACLFIDDLDILCGKKEGASKDMDKRIVNQFLNCLDEIRTEKVFVIACSSKSENQDPSVRRPGRLDYEITLKIPEEKERCEIIEKMMYGVACKITNDPKDNTELSEKNTSKYSYLGKRSNGYVAADFEGLITEAGYQCIKRLKLDQEDDESDSNSQEEELESYSNDRVVPKVEIIDNEQECVITEEDFDKAFELITPIGKKEGFNMVPDTTWEDVGALGPLKSEQIKAIINPINNPERCKLFNIKPHAGVLLYGLPGCGKTLQAKAIANAANANFISVKGPELLNKYVGESERAIRSLFQRAKECSPCLIFFDEFDALCPKRGSDGNQVTERIVNQLLTEMNGVEELRNVYIIGATNRPDIIDSAILRPGRQGTHLYVPIPSKEDRFDILKALSRKMPIDKDVEQETIAYTDKLANFSGADLSALVENAAKNAAWAGMNLRDSISKEDFEVAMGKTKCSISKDDIKFYKNLTIKFE